MVVEDLHPLFLGLCPEAGNEVDHRASF